MCSSDLSGPMPPKFGTLDSLKGDSGRGREDDDDEAGPRDQQFYVGGTGQGGGGSGQNVIDPAKLLDRARQLGAVSASEHEGSSSRAFLGSGYSMSGENAEPVVKNEDPNKIKHTITLWKNGFTVDDGALRSYDDPANNAFLADINKGRVPDEFAGEKDPFVSIVSKTGDEYAAPANAAARTFTGEGQTLGGTAAAAASAAAAGPVQAPSAQVTLDESQPLTTIQIRLHDGTRLTQRFNLTDTVGSIYTFVASATPGAEFDLNMSFPRKKLEDRAQSIADAQLQNAALTQSLK